MKYGFWAPVFGGWLRNVRDENMEASWDYFSRLCRRAEEIGYDLTLIAELNLNDIKGVKEPAMDAWSSAAALAAVTKRLEIMVAVRPNFHHPALFAKAAANIDNISNGRLALNVVSSWWADEATQYGLQFDQHDDRYGRTAEWLTVVDGLWSQTPFNHQGERYQLTDAICEPLQPARHAPVPRTCPAPALAETVRPIPTLGRSASRCVARGRMGRAVHRKPGMIDVAS